MVIRRSPCRRCVAHRPRAILRKEVAKTSTYQVFARSDAIPSQELTPVEQCNVLVHRNEGLPLCSLVRHEDLDAPHTVTRNEQAPGFVGNNAGVRSALE